MKPLLAEIEFSDLANALMSALGARSHEWHAWLLIEATNGEVELLLIAKKDIQDTGQELTKHWSQKKFAKNASPSQAILEILRDAHEGQNGALEPQIPTWKDVPADLSKRAFAQGKLGQQAFQANQAVKVRSSAGYIAYESTHVPDTETAENA